MGVLTGDGSQQHQYPHLRTKPPGMTRLAKGKVQPFASTGGVKAEETARAIAKGAAANATYVAAVLTMKPLAALLLVIGLRSECLGVLPPRLLQGHSPSGEPQCMDLVGKGTCSGEDLVKCAALDFGH